MASVRLNNLPRLKLMKPFCFVYVFIDYTGRLALPRVCKTECNMPCSDTSMRTSHMHSHSNSYVYVMSCMCTTQPHTPTRHRAQFEGEGL